MPTCRDCRQDYIGHDLTVRCPDCAKRVIAPQRQRLAAAEMAAASRQKRAAK